MHGKRSKKAEYRCVYKSDKYEMRLLMRSSRRDDCPRNISEPAMLVFGRCPFGFTACKEILIR